MNRTNAQFALVFIGVLLLHLAAATALMKSAQTDEPDRSAATTPDPTYHSPAAKSTEPARGPGGKGKPESVPARKDKPIPDAFADLAVKTPAPPAGTVSPPPIPEKSPTGKESKEPAPEPPTRRLTVTQLLAADPTGSKVKPLDAGKSSAPAPLADIPKVERVPPVTEPKKGPRKVRSLSGN